MPQRPRKLQRASKACDFCHRRGIKCDKNRGSFQPCQNCADFDVRCTYERPSKRRGVRSDLNKEISEPVQHRDRQHGVATSPSRQARSQPAVHPEATDPSLAVMDKHWATEDWKQDDNALLNSWKAFAIACQSVVQNLVQVYFEIVYPIFPLFHRPSFLRELQDKAHIHNQGLFASTMAMCALASARARDGALYSSRWCPSQLSNPPSEVFCTAAKESIPRDLTVAKGVEYMRACAILSIVSIQNGQIQDMHQYAGMYHTLSVMGGLHDEKLWPRDLSLVETEVRRRLFWSMYTLDVYSAIVWGRIIRFREAQSNVRYPGNVNDDSLDSEPGVSSVLEGRNATLMSAGHSDQPVAWMRGWNFTTDLYRILEHAIDYQRRSSYIDTESVWSLFCPTPVSGSLVMEHVDSMFSALPSQLRVTDPATGVQNCDIVGFQSANIQATLQLLRMVLSSSEDQGVEEKCEVAGNVLTVFSKVPIEYLKAISSPLFYHLGGIGYILGSVMEGSLSEVSYQRVRKLLLEMAALLHRLESGISRSTGASERLKTQVQRIDDYMQKQRPSNAHGGLVERSTVSGPAYVENRYSPSLYGEHGLQSSQEHLTEFDDPLAFFQLPQDLLDDWPWSSDTGLLDGMFPMAFDKVKQ